MDTLTRDAVREHCDADERDQYQTEVREWIEQAMVELQKLHRLAQNLPYEYEAPEQALELVAALTKNRRNPRPGAVIDQLLADAELAAIKLSRAHKCTWEQIGTATGEHRNNLQTRLAQRYS